MYTKDLLNEIFDSVLPMKVYSAVAKDPSTFSKVEFYPYNVIKNTNDGQVTSYVLEAALAGIRKSEVEITIKEDLLIIEVNPDSDLQENGVEYLRRGISKKPAKLELKLMGIDVKKIEARFDEGLLIVTMPAAIKKIESNKIKIK
jgi:HSP20 family protein